MPFREETGVSPRPLRPEALDMDEQQDRSVRARVFVTGFEGFELVYLGDRHEVVSALDVSRGPTTPQTTPPPSAEDRTRTSR